MGKTKEKILCEKAAKIEDSRKKSVKYKGTIFQDDPKCGKCKLLIQDEKGITKEIGQVLFTRQHDILTTTNSEIYSDTLRSDLIFEPNSIEINKVLKVDFCRVGCSDTFYQLDKKKMMHYAEITDEKEFKPINFD